MASLNFFSIFKNNPLDLEEFRWQGHMMIDFLADYYVNVEKYLVLVSFWMMWIRFFCLKNYIS
jgi:hypothetical protein